MVPTCAGKDSWKARNEALGTVQEKAAQMAKFGILPSAACKEIITALTRRFADSNQNLRPKAVDTIAAIAAGVGKDIEKVMLPLRSYFSLILFEVSVKSG